MLWLSAVPVAAVVTIVGTTRVAMCCNCLLWQQFCCSLLQCVAVCCKFVALLWLYVWLVLPCASITDCDSSCVAVSCSESQSDAVSCTAMITHTTHVAMCSNYLLWQQLCCSISQCVAKCCSELHCCDYTYHSRCHMHLSRGLDMVVPDFELHVSYVWKRTNFRLRWVIQALPGPT